MDPEKQSLRPDEQFLEMLAGVVGSECPSLTSILSLTSSEMEEVEQNRNQLPCVTTPSDEIAPITKNQLHCCGTVPSSTIDH